MATSTIKVQACVLRKIANYSNITIPSVGYVKIDSFSNLGVSSDLFLISMEVRGWNGNSVPQIVKGQNGVDIYAVGASGTYPSFGVEYFFLTTLNAI